MSASVSSNTSFNSRRSAGNSKSDGRSNHRSDRANPHDEFHGIKFVFGRPDQRQESAKWPTLLTKGAFGLN